MTDVGETLEMITKGCSEIIQVLKSAMDWIPSQDVTEDAESNSVNPC